MNFIRREMTALNKGESRFNSEAATGNEEGVDSDEQGADSDEQSADSDEQSDDSDEDISSEDDSDNYYPSEDNSSNSESSDSDDEHVLPSDEVAKLLTDSTKHVWDTISHCSCKDTATVATPYYAPYYLYVPCVPVAVRTIPTNDLGWLNGVNHVSNGMEDSTT